MRIQFLIRALSLGGAERQLVLLAEGLARRGHKVEVLTFYQGLPVLEQRLERQAIKVVQLRKRGRADVLGFIRSLKSAVNVFEPDVVYSFLPTANVISALVFRQPSHPAIVWGIRSSSVSLPGYDWLGRALARLERWLRKSPHAVICNSRAGYDLYRTLEFPVDRLSIVRNALDLEENRFDPEARARFRVLLGVRDSTLVVGAAGRIDPVKGFEVLIKAVAAIRDSLGDVVLAIAGDGPADYRRSLETVAAQAGVADRVKWMGRVDCMKDFYSAVDVFCSSSIGAEATSNVIAEALSCERLTIATAVGDSPELLADASLIARPGEVDSLANALASAVALLPNWEGARARARIAASLSVDTAIEETEQALMRASALRRSGDSVTRQVEF